MSNPQDLLTDANPLIGAARLGKLRLVRLLLEGGAHVNERDPQGETPLLAACKALRGEPSGPGTLKLLRYLLDNQADPNAQDRSGRTALMWSCMARAGAPVASTLISAGADPTMEDSSGASALVYAINGQHQPTLQVLLDACRAKGRDIIIITTEMGAGGGSVTERLQKVPPPLDMSPAPCMSPSDIIIKTGSPNSPEGDNVFNFRGSGKRGSCSNSQLSPCELSSVSQSSTPLPRQRQWFEPWQATHNLAQLNKVCQEGGRERLGEKGGEGDRGSDCHDCNLEQMVLAKRERAKEEKWIRSAHHHQRALSQAATRLVFPPTTEHLPPVYRSRQSPETSLAAGGFGRETNPMTQRCFSDRLAPGSPSPWQGGRRNTLPSLTPPPPLFLFPQSCYESHLQVPSAALPVTGVWGQTKQPCLLTPPTPPLTCSVSSSPYTTSKSALRPGSLPRLPLSSSSVPAVPLPNSSLVYPLPTSSERARRSPRRHSIQLEPLSRSRGAGVEEEFSSSVALAL